MQEISHRTEPTRADGARRKWTKPTLTSITAGSAELNVGVSDDGVDLS